jgi:putative glutamine amidotransferase
MRQWKHTPFTRVKEGALCYGNPMTTPLIGVSTSITIGKSPERAYLNSAYVAAVQQAGGVPVLLVPQHDARALRALLERIDGVLLTGGGDVDPARFGEEPHPTVSDVSAERDVLEIALARHALEERMPLLAICRGVQVLNVALGGSLHQDVANSPGTPIAHSQKAPRHEPTHAVKIEAGSRLADVVGAHDLDVNSMHHQAIKELGQGLRAVAFSSPDGLIEAVEPADARGFLLGVQWHPEELAPHQPAARRLFAALIAAASRR